MLAAAACADQAAGLGRAGEAHPADAGVRDERGAGLLADPLDDVEDAGREAGLGGQVGEDRARERRPLGRLQDDGAAGGERGRRLPGREHEGRVPRRDDRGRAGGHADDAVLGRVARPVALLVGLGEVGVASVVARAAGDDARPQRALEHRHVEALDGREPLDVGVDQVGEPAQVRRRGPPGPSAAQAGKASAAAATAMSTSACTGPRHLGEQALVDGRAILEPLVARHPPPADPVVGRDRDARDGAHAEPRGPGNASGRVSRPARGRCRWRSPAATARAQDVSQVSQNGALEEVAYLVHP